MPICVDERVVDNSLVPVESSKPQSWSPQRSTPRSVPVTSIDSLCGFNLQSHQMQRLPGTFGQPRRPPIAPGPPSIQVEEADIESDIEIKLDGTNDSRTGLTGNGYTTVRFNDMVKE